MNYRTLGNTGIRVSEIGLGCEGFIENDQAWADRIFDKAIAAGVNMMDLYSPNPAMREKVRKALGERRVDFVLQGHFCSVWENGQYVVKRDLEQVQAGFEVLLNELGTDYLDVGMIHYIDSLEVWETVCSNGVIDWVQSLKHQGRIRAVGLSSHNPLVAIRAIEDGLIDTLMFSVNPCYDLQPPGEDVEQLWSDETYINNYENFDPDRVRLYELCEERGVGISVMKCFGGGDLLNEELSPAGKALTAVQCMHYALTRPGVASIMAGVRNEADLDSALAYVDATEEEKDYAAALSDFPRVSWKGHCMYCSHCAPCPSEISVADVTRFLNLVRAQGTIPETVREHYKALSHHASECIECGQCESRCPFDVGIIANMREAAEVFGF